MHFPAGVALVSPSTLPFPLPPSPHPSLFLLFTSSQPHLRAYPPYFLLNVSRLRLNSVEAHTMSSPAVVLGEEELNYIKCAKFAMDIFAGALREVFRESFFEKFHVPWRDQVEYGNFIINGGLPPWQKQQPCTLGPVQVSISAATLSSATPMLQIASGALTRGTGPGQVDIGHAIRLG